MRETDVLIIGSEGAGARAAIAASLKVKKVLVISKGRMGRSGATITAGADIDVDSRSAKEFLGLKGDPNDSKEIFFEDMVIEGKYINNQKLVEVHVEDAPIRIKELIDWGMLVTDFVIAPGHRYPRGVYSSGKEQMKALINEVKRHPNIELLEDTMVLDLLKSGKRIVGAVGLNLRTGELEVVSAKAVIIATGGAHMIFPVQTGPEELTGDGQAMAWRAGAELVDMEMTQFLPATFLEPPAWRGSGFPFLIGPGGGMHGWLLNRFGERFMAKWDPKRMEQQTRDILAVAIMTEVVEGRGSPAGGAFLSFAHLPKNLVEYFTSWYGKPFLNDDWTYKGFKFRSFMEEVKNGRAMEVGPASHFFMGGIRVDTEGATNLEGLYAAGEVSGGLHGGNRLSGNACTQIVVQGKRAGEAAARYAFGVDRANIDQHQTDELSKRYFAPLERGKGINPYSVKKKIHKISWEKVGVLRSGEGLQEALKEIEEIQKTDLPQMSCVKKQRIYNREWMEALQVENMLTMLKAVALSALERKESRGAHYRRDFLKMNNRKWLRNIVTANENGEMVLHLLPVVMTKYTPQAEEK
jgi:succinate dehydrogenase/fumarate reductase flavoprotein subunit